MWSPHWWVLWDVLGDCMHFVWFGQVLVWCASRFCHRAFHNPGCMNHRPHMSKNGCHFGCLVGPQIANIYKHIITYTNMIKHGWLQWFHMTLVSLAHNFWVDDWVIQGAFSLRSSKCGPGFLCRYATSSCSQWWSNASNHTKHRETYRNQRLIMPSRPPYGLITNDDKVQIRSVSDA